MKPDGVATAAMEPMETLESNPVNEAAPPTEQEPDQATVPAGEETLQQQAGQGEPQPNAAKEPPAAKTSNKTSGDSKAKATNKATAKTKPAAPGASKPSSGSRPNSTMSRIANGKPQTNGTTKKATPAADKKSAPASAPTKKPPGAAGAPAKSSAKVGEKKPPAASPANSGAKTTPGAPAAKKTPSTAANGLKSTTSAAAAKKPAAAKPLSAAPTKPGSVASPKPDKPPVSKATRPATGASASSRPATGSSHSVGTAKNSTAASKPATPKTAPTTAKAATPKSTSTTPSGGKPPVSQTSRTTTSVKRDVTKPATSAAKKPADSPLSRPSSTTKSAKPDTPKSASKSDVATKKPTASKAAETKTLTQRPKPATPSKEPSKTPGAKKAATKTPVPKKTVGSSTPTPVKRGPKAATVDEPVKETAEAVAEAVAAAAALATEAVMVAGLGEPQPPVEACEEQPAAGPEAGKEPVLESVPEAVLEPTPKPVREPTPEPVREPTPEPVREPTPEPVREPTPEPVREPTPEPVREPTPEPVREPTPEPVREVFREPTPEPAAELHQTSAAAAWEAEPVREPATDVKTSAQVDPFKFAESPSNSAPSLGTTVMSPPCSPAGPSSPVRELQDASSLLDMDAQPDTWDRNQAPVGFAPRSPVNAACFQTEREKENVHGFESQEEEEEEDKENLFMPSSTAAGAFSAAPQPHFLGASPLDDFPAKELISPHEKEEAVEKADEEINEDIEEEEEEDEEQRRLGHQLSAALTDMSVSQPSDEFPPRSSAFGGSAGWPADDLLSGMDSEDVSSCTSSRQQGVSDQSSTQHTALLEGTQSSDALIDSSLRGSEGDGNLMGSPNVETLANEEEEDEDEDERVDDMDMSSEKVEEHHAGFRQHDDEEDDDVEMHSEGVTESCGNADDDDFNEERLDNLNFSAPPAPSWGQTNPFADTWAQPASVLDVSSPSPLSEHGAAESETPTQSPAQARLDSAAPPFSPQSEMEPRQQRAEEAKSPAPEAVPDLLAAPAVGMSQSSTLSGTALAAHSGSETSTPEELRDYDSSSGVESRSDKQHTPVPAALQPDMDQDLGIHMEKGDGEEEEAETLPADEVLGTGPPTAPASTPSSPSTSGDEASDTEGEMQINDPEAPMTMDQRVGFDTPPPNCSLPALEEDEEAGDTAAAEGEEDGGGATPQSANSVASYGFDCTTSNSNAHSMAESCGKSPGIFSLENEEQLPEEAKDPSLIKELTLPSAAAAQAEDLLGGPVDLVPLGHPEDNFPSLDDHHYLLGGNVSTGHLKEVDPLEPRHHRGDHVPGDAHDSQAPYYSTVCDKTDSFLEGNV